MPDKSSDNKQPTFTKNEEPKSCTVPTLDLVNETEANFHQVGWEKWLNKLLCRGDLAKESFQARPVGFTELFKYGSKRDRLLVLVGILTGILTGIIQPLCTIIEGKLANCFIEFDQNKTSTQEMQARVLWLITVSVALGVVLLVVSLVQNYVLKVAARNITASLRARFIWSVLRQDASWFDQQKFGSLNQQLNDNIQRIHDGIGDKIGLLLRVFAQFVTALIICLFMDYRIVVAMILCAPISCLTMSFMARMISTSTMKQLPLMDKSGAILQETVMNIKTVQACNAQNQLLNRFALVLYGARIHGVLIGVWQGLFDGLFFLCLYVFFGVGMVYGGWLHYHGEISGGDVIGVTTVLLLSIYFIGFISPHLMAIFKARVSAAVVYRQIEMIPSIDCYNSRGLEIAEPKGHIRFENVEFAYPSRRTKKVLHGISWEARPAETVALVGHSGCGKSTSMGLITRLYECTRGRVTIDGVNVTSLKISALRAMIGIVQQEPTLFNGTIFENVQLGDESITRDRVVAACKMANAHEFITALDDGYDTLLGAGGVQLSGGQKQRVAIARAVVHNPPILLLDEATSALDAESELHVQQALRDAARGRTTVVIAHRLSTLRDAQRVVVYAAGEVREVGTHAELSRRPDGIYAALVKAQQFQVVEKPQGKAQPPNLTEYTTPIQRGCSFRGSSQRSIATTGSTVVANHGESEPTEPIRYGLWTLYNNCGPHYWKLLLGAVFGCLRGIELPLYVYLLSSLFSVFRNLDRSYDLFMADLLSVGYFSLGVGFLCLTAFFNWAAEDIVNMIKVRLLGTLLRKNAAYFDKPMTSNAKLIQRITNDSHKLRAALDIRLYHVCNNLFASIFQILLALWSSWQVGLTGIVVYGLFALAIWAFSRSTQRSLEDVQRLDHSPKLAVEIIENTRTIQLLCREHYFQQKYVNALETPKRKELMTALTDSLSFAFCQCTMFISDAACYGVGSLLIANYGQDVNAVYLACTMMSTMAWSVLFVSLSLVEILHAVPASNSLFGILNDAFHFAERGDGGCKPEIAGDVRVDKVFFAYPTRPDVNVANGLSVRAQSGQTIALVGPSGGGKSTIINLLQRFYEPRAGEIRLDSTAIHDIQLHHLRTRMALVGQEPVLFSGTIYENATLGVDGVDREHVMEAFRLANASDFIEKLPKGYDTEVGEKGAQLSGGQKQRVAIARALVRQPTVLLLDEATSALDAESERAVQRALDRAAAGRTCIMIAHRLSAVQHAHCIFFVSNGRVVECGTHAQLMEADGGYAQLIRKQDLSTDE